MNFRSNPQGVPPVILGGLVGGQMSTPFLNRGHGTAHRQLFTLAVADPAKKKAETEESR